MNKCMLIPVIVFCWLGVSAQRSPQSPARTNSRLGITTRPSDFVTIKTRLPFTSAERPYTVAKLPIWDIPGQYNYVLDGDIVIGNTLPKTRLYSLSDADKLWKGDIPIELDASVNNNKMCETVNDAIREFHRKTKVRFVMRTTQDDYIRIVINSPCSGCGGLSPFGRQGGRQDVLIAPGQTAGVIIHEVLHSLGVWHEQSREDRDDYVEFIKSNTRDEYVSQFEKQPGRSNGLYDFGSIMHYGRFDFGKQDPVSKTILPTLKCKVNGREVDCPDIMGQRTSLSLLDAEGVNNMYRNVPFNDKSVREVSLPATGSETLVIKVGWEDQYLRLKKSVNSSMQQIVSANDAVNLVIQVPQTAVIQKNICSGQEERWGYKNYQVTPLRLTVNEDFSGYYKLCNFSAAGLPVGGEDIRVSVTLNDLWLPGSSNSVNPYGKSGQFMVWVEEEEFWNGYHRIMLKGGWFNNAIVPPRYTDLRAKRKLIQTDGPVQQNRSVRPILQKN